MFLKLVLIYRDSVEGSYIDSMIYTSKEYELVYLALESLNKLHG
jgi:hypothetical protein